MSQPCSRRRLPTGVQTFREIRTENRYYVDKTPFALQLFSQGKHFCFSRPRRFGKSLFLSTLKELFEGNRNLFQGLAAYEGWDWSVRRPVARLSFGGGLYTRPGGLHNDLLKQLRSLERSTGAELAAVEGSDRFAELLEELHRLSGRRVAVLIDEYDKPITDNLDEPDLARRNRNYLRALYSTLKDCDEHIRCSFLTGVTKFFNVSLFSGVNNLNDLTLDPRHSSLCGYTDHDLDTVFAPELRGLDRDEIRRRYSGYSWGGQEKVYNPYDVLLLFEKRDFRAWWFETCTPGCSLAETLVRRRVPAASLDGLHATDELLSAFDIGSISTAALLFQTGYLTVERSELRAGQRHYRLRYPNREVRASLNRHLLAVLAPPPEHDAVAASQRLHAVSSLSDHLRAARFDQLQQSLRAFFHSIPHDWNRNNELDRYEGYYASVFFALLNGCGLDARPEEASSQGNLDLAVLTRQRIVLFEFKTVPGRQGSGLALRQLKAKGYAAKHLASGKPVHLVGVEFSREARNVALVEWETAGPAEASSSDA